MTDEVWTAVKAEAKAMLSECARAQQTMTYGSLVGRMRLVEWIPRDHRLFELLGEISTEEAAAGRGMLSALVVTQDDGVPGPGFFDLASELGRDTTDRERCWVREVQRVYTAWREDAGHGGN